MRRSNEPGADRAPPGVLRLRYLRRLVLRGFIRGVQRWHRRGARRGRHRARRVRARGQDGRVPGVQRHGAGGDVGQRDRSRGENLRRRLGELHRKRGRRFAHAADALPAAAAAAAGPAAVTAAAAGAVARRRRPGSRPGQATPAPDAPAGTNATGNSSAAAPASGRRLLRDAAWDAAGGESANGKEGERVYIRTVRR